MAINSHTINLDTAIRATGEFASGQCLDPSLLLSMILTQLRSTDIPLAVTLSDGSDEVSFSLGVFLSKNYEVRSNRIKFGFKSLSADGLRVSIRCDIVALVPEPVLRAPSVVRRAGDDDLGTGDPVEEEKES